MVLVKWSGWPESMATWEDAADLKRRFPSAPAWGQAVLQEGGDVSIRPSSDAANDGPRPSQPKKPSTRVSGSEWVNMLARMNRAEPM
jgi:hypothetical protein